MISATKKNCFLAMRSMCWSLLTEELCEHHRMWHFLVFDFINSLLRHHFNMHFMQNVAGNFEFKKQTSIWWVRILAPRSNGLSSMWIGIWLLLASTFNLTNVCCAAQTRPKALLTGVPLLGDCLCTFSAACPCKNGKHQKSVFSSQCSANQWGNSLAGNVA